MQRIAFFVLLLTLIGCSKEEFSSHPDSVIQVDTLTKEFIKANERDIEDYSPDLRKISNKEVARAVGADCAAAVGIISQTGWLAALGGGMFLPLYAVGVTAVTTMASYGAMRAIPDAGNTLQKEKISQDFIEMTVTSESNPFEHIGILHNQGLASLGHMYGVDNDNLSFMQKDSTLLLLYDQEMNNFTIHSDLSDIARRFIFYSTFDSKSGDEILTEAYDQNKLSEPAYLLGQNYLKAAEFALAYDGFANYALAFEEIVQSCTQLSIQEKNKLLIMSCVGRYSAAYWINASNLQ